jgi:hypothetical protein
MFNLNDYEDVATRIKRVHDNFPMVRFNIRELKVDHQAGYCYAVTEIYRDANDATPAAVDVAYEARSDRGVNRDFWVENCITSSYGRTAGLLLGTDKRPTRQDMEKAQSKIMEPVTSDINGTSRQAAEPVANAMALLVDQLGAEEIEKPPICNHGSMVLKSGSKNGRDYKGYTCQLGKTSESCESIWYKIGADGKWHAPKKPAFEVKAGRSLVTEMLNGES